MLPNRIAFAGYSGVGKDEAAKVLYQYGYVRHNFGDIIKGDVDELIKKHFGFSAFTEVREEKAKIRRTLESFGEDNYESVTRRFFERLPSKTVNTRLIRVAEARRWKETGGVIVRIDRLGVGAFTAWELDRMLELEASGLIDARVINDGSSADLHEKIMSILS